MQALFFSSSTSNNQISKGQTNFQPIVMGGGVINQNGDIGNREVSFNANNQAQGGSLGLDFSMPMMPMQLVNLDKKHHKKQHKKSHSKKLQNLDDMDELNFDIHSNADLHKLVDDREAQFY